MIVLLGPGLAPHTGQLLVEIPDLRGDLQSHAKKVILALQVCQRVLSRSDAQEKEEHVELAIKRPARRIHRMAPII